MCGLCAYYLQQRRRSLLPVSHSKVGVASVPVRLCKGGFALKYKKAQKHKAHSLLHGSVPPALCFIQIHQPPVFLFQETKGECTKRSKCKKKKNKEIKKEKHHKKPQ